MNLEDKNKITAAKTEFDAKIQEIKDKVAVAETVVAHPSGPTFNYEDAYCQLCNQIEYLDYRFKNIYSAIERLWDSHYEHQKGHLPSVSSPAEMQKAIDKLGLGDSYVVEKRHIYASNGDQVGLSLDIRLKE